MNKTQKELAFLRELVIESEWTARFTDYFDKKFKFDGKEDKILYINAGAGTHAIALRETLNEKNENVEVYAISENEDLRNIAQTKADAIGADVRFGTNFSGEKYDVVIADGSFIPPYELDDLLGDVVDSAKDRIALFLPTKGSFGEIFSFLWETLLNADLLEKAENVERLIAETPTIDDIKDKMKNLGLQKIDHSTETEFIEFKDGTEFINSPLVADFLFPVWLDFLEDDEVEKAGTKLAELIDAEDGELTFRFSVKNTLFTGEKR